MKVSIGEGCESFAGLHEFLHASDIDMATAE
jgi:hypothetical protein